MGNESLSPEDRLEVMNLAWEMIKGASSMEDKTLESKIERTTKLFDQAYKAIAKTVFESVKNREL